jgi:hypothetical protein
MSYHSEDAVYAAMIELDFDSYALYDHTEQALKNYVYYRLAPGSFLTAVLTGESVEHCLALADAWNRKGIEEIFRFVNEQLPPSIHGSPQAYINWVWRKDS